MQIMRHARRVRAYGGPVRSAQREARRRLDSVSRRRESALAVADTYWWEFEPNFGDELTAWLFPHHGISVRRRPVERASVVGIGSIIEHLPCDFSGSIFGSGLLRDESRSLPNADVIALRGRLSQDRLGASPRVLGDPGLLVANLGVPASGEIPVALVPHLSHRRHPDVLSLSSRHPDHVRMIDASCHPEVVVHAIARSRVVISTSLHGLIVADALGIPAVWAVVEPGLVGGRFKFHDYESVVTPGDTREVTLTADTRVETLVSLAECPDSDVLAHTVRDLGAALSELRSVLPRRGRVAYFIGS